MPPLPRRIAAIDIGTNTVLLLIASVDADDRIVPLLDEQRLPRLGRGVDASRRLDSGSMERVIRVLLEYRALIDRSGVDRCIVTGTSAVRDAANRDDFCAQVRAATGFDVIQLSGDEEALLTYRGAVSGLDRPEATLVLDIGGGSTEIIGGDGTTIHFRSSLDIGAVRVTERFFRADPPAQEEIVLAGRHVRDVCTGLPMVDIERTRLVGVAGTAATLALLDQGITSVDRQAIINYRLTERAVHRLLLLLQHLSAGEIQRLSDAMTGRSDIITAGTLILHIIMQHFGFRELTVSDRGLRFGAVLRAAGHEGENVAKGGEHNRDVRT